METTELIFSAFVALFGLHSYFLMRFKAATEDGTDFDFAKWWNENRVEYFWSLLAVGIIFFSIGWQKADVYYAENVLANYPILDVLKPHIVMSFIVGYYGTKWLREMLKATTK